ncbi:encapsulin [Pyrobaculum ferrireducens]|uniref:Linocin_M18 bacteriocin protein n=1 Tax=Pyrobaculum ferrireducens TaxID=1104324 RepID=G7VHY5_9CREN|nr:family 1 encapsulin nanocompartment shell protein [Pyrobaculum ferrireducens]AET33345.1 Linocin_M18 bacteriocin protein [Pyrobaculum ferrireducens]
MVFAKNPIDRLRERGFDVGDVGDALRLAIIAELDAISLYLQLARYAEDERVRRVFQDVANEERTHFGEFLALLKEYDPQLAGELEAGAKEVRELAGVGAGEGRDPPSNGGWISQLAKQVADAAAAARRFRKVVATYKVGRGADAVAFEVLTREGKAERRITPLRELKIRFTVSQQQVDLALSRGAPVESVEADKAAVKLAYEEDAAVLGDLLKSGDVVEISSWDRPGSAVQEVAKAVAELYRRYVPEPYVLFVSPGRFAKLVAVEEKTGVMELTRVKTLVRDVVALPQLGDNDALLISIHPSVADIAVGVDAEVIYLGPEEGGHGFLLRETFAVRVKNPAGVLALRVGG